MTAGTRVSPHIAGNDPSTDTEATRTGITVENGDAAMSDANKIILSVFGSTLTVSVALAALILTRSSHTRQQFSEQIDLVRLYSDSQFGQLREDLREVRGDVRELHGEVHELRGEVREVRGDVRELRGEVRMLAGRQAKVEGLLFAVHPPGLVPPSEARGADSSASRTGPKHSPESSSLSPVR